ncbi:MAG: 4-hydroxy-tetrahydrodipicolinate reductase [Rickettsiales bacterium]|nr:4-hydroxy-tetrahydrodipicolinate reductase [Rickettsiales bacterium]
MTILGIAGCTGRMGVVLLAEALKQPNVKHVIGSVRTEQLGGALDQLAALGLDRSRLTITDNLDELYHAESIIDFTRPELTIKLAEKSSQTGTALISGTTGLDDAQMSALKDAAQNAPILWSSNMSVGVNLLMNLVETAASALNDHYDIEIVEMHHRQKVDAPSGTALSLGEAAAKGRGVNLSDVQQLSREGNTGERPKGEIGFATLRGGQVIGDHTVMFAGSNDRIELTHKSQSRDIYAEGAVKAALWAISQSNGYYSMQDVLKG